MKEDFYSIQKENEEINLGTIFRFLLMQSKLIISIVLIVFLVSYANYKFSTKFYKIESLLQYESFNQNIFDPSNTIQMASGNPSIDIMNLATLYESRTNLLKVIKDLKLNIDIKDLLEGENIDVNIFSKEKNKFKNHNLIFSFLEDGYALLDENKNMIATSNYGEYIYFNDLEILINSSNIPINRTVEINFRHHESMYNLIKYNLNVDSTTSMNSFFRNEGLITVSYITPDPELGKDIVNYANKIFLNQRISVETEKSRKAIEFIDKNIESLEKVVESNKIKLKEFKEVNKSIDVALEIETIMQKIQSLDQSLSSIDFEISESQELYTKNNPVYLNLLNKKKIIENQKEDVLSEIELMPKEQQEYIDLFNNLQVSQSLFEELETRRLGFSILEASTIGDMRVVDNAYYVSRVSPQFTSVILLTFLSLLFSCILAIIRGYNFLPLSNPAELFDNNIHLPIIGVIPEKKDILQTRDDPSLNSSIESLIFNIDSSIGNQTNKNIITVTSPSPDIGKSTMSIKIAEEYSKLGSKILLIDCDLKRGSLGKNYNIRSINEDIFHSIDESNIDNFNVEGNLYFIPRVKGLNNSFQFIYSDAYKKKINFFKDYFDYVIIDTPPILSVADTSVTIEYSDFNILVVRHGVTKINEINQSIDNFAQIDNNIDGVIYNSYSKPRSYYGYYGMFGNYSYQYYAEKYLDDVYDYKKSD